MSLRNRRLDPHTRFFVKYSPNRKQLPSWFGEPWRPGQLRGVQAGCVPALVGCARRRRRERVPGEAAGVAAATRGGRDGSLALSQPRSRALADCISRKSLEGVFPPARPQRVESLPALRVRPSARPSLPHHSLLGGVSVSNTFPHVTPQLLTASVGMPRRRRKRSCLPLPS